MQYIRPDVTPLASYARGNAGAVQDQRANLAHEGREHHALRDASKHVLLNRCFRTLAGGPVGAPAGRGTLGGQPFSRVLASIAPIARAKASKP